MIRMFNYLRVALRNYDSFGVSFDFNIKGKKQYQSVCGGILTVLMSVVLFFIFISGLISILQREKFQIYVQQKQNMNPEYNEMNISNFMLAIKVDDPFKSYYPNENKTAFSYVVDQILIITAKDGSRNKTVISQQQLEICGTEHFINVDYQGQDYFCLPLNYSLKLQGTFNSEYFYYPTIKIQVCNTESCYSNEQLAPFAINQSFMLRMSSLIQSSQYIRDSQENQILSTLNSDFFLQTNLLQESKADIFFKNNKVQVNKNLLSLYSEFENKSFWAFSIFNYREYQQYHSKPENIFSINLRISQDYEEIKKQVNTFDDFLSYFGGLLKIISPIFGIIAIKYNELGLRISVANHLYQFNIPKKINGQYQYSYDNLLTFIEAQINRVSELQSKLKNCTKNILQTTRYMKLWVSYKFGMSNSNMQRQEQSDSLRSGQIEQFQVEKYVDQLQQYKLNFLSDLIVKINEIRPDLRLGLNFIFHELICCSCCCEQVKQTRKMLNKCEKIINRDLDIIHLLKKIQEIDKLKQILLAEDQIKIFDYTPKPVINIVPKYQRQQQSVMLNQNTLLSKVKQEIKRQASQRKKQVFTAPKRLIEIYESYSKLKEDQSILNQRIISLLGPTIELIFQNYYSISQMAQKFNQQEKDKQEQIQIFNQNDEKQSTPVTGLSRRKIQSQQFIQINPKHLNSFDEDIKDE